MSMMLILCIVLCAGTCNETKRDFEHDQLNLPPPGFAFTPDDNEPSHEWQVVQDGDNQLLARCPVKSEDRHVSVAIIEQPELLEVFVSARIKCEAGERDKNGGIVWRYADPKNYLLARLDIADKRIRLYRVVNGHRVIFGEETDLKLAAGTWYTLRVEHRHEKIKVYLDNEALIIEKDTHFQNAGRVGMYANEDSATCFDDLEIHSMCEPK